LRFRAADIPHALRAPTAESSPRFASQIGARKKTKKFQQTVFGIKKSLGKKPKSIPEHELLTAGDHKDATGVDPNKATKDSDPHLKEMPLISKDRRGARKSACETALQ
jgi:hypothetical protein